MGGGSSRNCPWSPEADPKIFPAAPGKDQSDSLNSGAFFYISDSKNATTSIHCNNKLFGGATVCRHGTETIHGSRIAAYEFNPVRIESCGWAHVFVRYGRYDTIDTVYLGCAVI